MRKKLKFKYKIGDTFSADGFTGSDITDSKKKINLDKGEKFAFLIVAVESSRDGNHKYLGVKQGVTYTDENPECYWFNQSGEWGDSWLSFNLKNKIKDWNEIHTENPA